MSGFMFLLQTGFFVFVQDLEGSKSDGKIQEKVTKKHDIFHF